MSDVLELVFDIDAAPSYVNEDWEAVMWALFTAAAKILEVPETELGGTMYENEMHGISLLIYDDVPGGAGHARQLSDRVPELVEEPTRSSTAIAAAARKHAATAASPTTTTR